MPMTYEKLGTNMLRKGQRVKLRNGWEAVLLDNMKGNVRMAEVYGHHTDRGSVYAHNIMAVQTEGGHWATVEHTPAQLKCKAMNEAMGF